MKSNLVYSTDGGTMCPSCRQSVVQCVCRQRKIPPANGVVRISLETKGRAGKGVTVIKGVPLDDVALVAYAKQLKTACGAGGTVKSGTIEIQGNHCELVMAELKKQGWVVKPKH